ncbi:MAG: glycosyltransferase family 9 protein [Acetobacteraceae bacterium]
MLPRFSPIPAKTIIAFVGRDLTGDGVMKLPFVRALRQAYPHARILWVAAGRSVFASTLRPLTRQLVDAVIEDTAIGNSWLDLLRRHPQIPRADLLLDTQRRVPTTLALRRQGAKIFVSAAAGWRLSALRPAERSKPASMLGQMLKLIEACGARPDLSRLPPLALPADWAAEATRRLLADGPYIGLAPGAGERHKCWPLGRFLALGRALSQHGLRPVVLLGPEEQDWRGQVAETLPEALLPIGPGDSPLLTMALARHFVAAVANDSGAGHLLAAAGTKLISLFGPTPAEKFAPFSPSLTIIRAQHFGATAMSAIPVQAVLKAVLDAAEVGCTR